MQDIIKGVREKTVDNRFDSDTFIQETIDRAEKIWSALKKKVQNEPNFIKLKEQERVEWLQTIDKEFQQEFPITCIYMLFHGQYNGRAFLRFLNKLKTDIKLDRTPQITSDHKKAEVDREDRWCQRQADYAEYLVMEIAKRHPDCFKQAKIAWNETYNSLKQEFKDFKKNFEDAKLNLEKKEEEFRKERIKELFDRITGEQKNVLSKEDRGYLKAKLKNLLLMQRKEKTMAELLKKIKLVN